VYTEISATIHTFKYCRTA